MKLIRCGREGHEIPAVLEADGTRRDISAFTPDLDARFFREGGIAALQAWYHQRAGDCPEIAADERLGSAVAMPPCMLCVGLNYADHARETGARIPTEPVLFGKAPTAVCGPDDDIFLPPGSQHLDYEVELGLVIGTTARHLDDVQAGADDPTAVGGLG